MSGDVAGAAPCLAVIGDEGARSAHGSKKPPRKPPMGSKKRKVGTTSTAPAATAQRTPTTPSPTDAPSMMYGTSPATSGINPCSPTTSSPAAQQVLGEMPASVDDETFLRFMDDINFGAEVDPCQEETFAIPENNDDSFDSEVEGDDEVELPKRKGSRGSNFTVCEDECLVKAWQSIALDAVTGDEQSGSTYWARIYEHFRQNNTSGMFRSQISVSRRWSFISACCTKWAACLEQVERLNPSGANGQDKVNIAQRLYKGKPKKKGGKAGKAFGLQHCWVLLQYDEKWRARNQEVPTKSKKSSNSCSPIDGEHVDVSSDDDSPTPISAPSSKRPPGRKAEKEKLKKVGENAYKESLDNMMTTRKEIAADRKEFKSARWMDMKEFEERKAVAEERRAAAEERRAAAEEQRAAVEERRAAAEERRLAAEERRLAAEEAAKRLEHEQRIMFMDQSNLDEKGRAYLELMRDQVLASRSMPGFYMGGIMGGPSGNGGNGGSNRGNGANGSSPDNGGGGSDE